jgi:hypothetical protein
LSIPYLLRRGPFPRAADVREVDAFEEHRELGGVELSAERVLVHPWFAEAALLKALVIEDEAAAVPGEHLRAVALLREEDEEVPREEVLLPLVLRQCAKPIDAVAHVDGLGGEEDADRPRKEEHMVRLA